VRPDKTIDRRAYTFCVLQAALAAFKPSDLYVMPSQRWGDPRVQLLTAKGMECAAHLGLPHSWPERATRV
jgi:hypothetical protein